MSILKDLLILSDIASILDQGGRGGGGGGWRTYPLAMRGHSALPLYLSPFHPAPSPQAVPPPPYLPLCAPSQPIGTITTPCMGGRLQNRKMVGPKPADCYIVSVNNQICDQPKGKDTHGFRDLIFYGQCLKGDMFEKQREFH